MNAKVMNWFWNGGILAMSGTEPVGLLQVEIVYERASANRVVCHARCISVGRSVFPGDSALPVDSQVDAGAPPARVIRMHRPPFGEFSELSPGWHAVVELEGTNLSWVQPEVNLRVVPPATSTEQRLR
ncbi:hypothetical protein [Streptomyces sp. NPDC048508]|uniref:hypothetical protein n=1 Tax=Streptomyces sp. NPDC048508 TaxID=3365561 RepID=UPI003717C8D0